VKKVFIAILALIYLGITTGLSVNLHYCMGKIASVEYGYKQTSACSVCGMENTDGCCHDELKIVKLNDSHQISKTNHDFLKAPIAFPERTFVLSEHFSAQGSYYPAQLHSPPDRGANPVYLLNSVFRI
jgi:hypothetical protein